MNKVELINQIAENVGVTKKQAEDMLGKFVEIITAKLLADDEVMIAGFGTFSAKIRKGRMGVNPQHVDQKIQIPSVMVPKFKAGKSLKDALKRMNPVPVTPTA